MNDDFEERSGEYWQVFKTPTKSYQKTAMSDDFEMLKKLNLHYVIESDGSGGERYVIDVATDRGTRTVDWWASTGLWKVRKGRGEGKGLYRMARYFQLIPRADEGC